MNERHLDIDRLARALDAHDDGCCIHDAHEAAVEVARLYAEDRKPHSVKELLADLPEPHRTELRDMVLLWVDEGWTTPPYFAEVYDILEAFGITDRETMYDTARPAVVRERTGTRSDRSPHVRSG